LLRIRKWTQKKNGGVITGATMLIVFCTARRLEATDHKKSSCSFAPIPKCRTS